MPEQVAVRRLTKAGIDKFREYLGELRTGSTAKPPRWLLTDSDTSEPFSPERWIEDRSFDTRLDAARYLCEVFEGLSALEEDVGLWSWLSLYFFDQVCPVRADGTRAPGRDYRHILEPGYLYGHRHLLGGPYLVYRLHGDEALLLLCTKVHVENLFHHELASRQALISNREIIRAATMLYLHPRRRTPKRGAQEGKRAPGNLRRFVDVLQQLDLTYDLYSMSAEKILELLPAEFDAWKPRRRFWQRLRSRRT
jgi:hypothetical protein